MFVKEHEFCYFIGSLRDTGLGRLLIFFNKNARSWYEEQYFVIQ